MINETRQLAAVMFTDMVSYTALMQLNETLALQKKDRFRSCFEQSIARHNGKVIQYYGDGVLSMFSSALNAVRSAIETQTQYLQDPRIDARIGIHTGEIMTDGAPVPMEMVSMSLHGWNRWQCREVFSSPINYTMKSKTSRTSSLNHLAFLS